MKIKNNEPPTKSICNKGFFGNSSTLPRSNFGVGGKKSEPQSAAITCRQPLAESLGSVFR